MKRALVSGALASTSVVLIGATIVVANSSDTVRAAPGTTVGSLDVAGMAKGELTQALDKILATNPTSLRVQLGSVSQAIEVAQLGLRVDVNATAERVLSESASSRKWGVFPADKGHRVRPVLTRADAQFAATVNTLLAAGNVQATDGYLRYRNGQISAVSPRAGQSVQEADVQQALQDAGLQLPLPKQVEVPAAAVAPTTDEAAVEAVATQARALLARPPLLSAGPQAVQVQATDLGPLLVLTQQTSLGLAAGAAELSTELASRLSRAPVEPTVSAPRPVILLTTKGNAVWRPTAATVTRGKAGRSGQTVTADDVLDALSEAVADAGARPTHVVRHSAAPPRSSTAGVDRINSVLGTFTTYYPCCPPRVSNIKLMARTLDGTLVGPGETFSINQTVGARTRAKGYVEAPFILDGELSTDVGGGVSQVGTTMMNAAFFAGVRLVAHKAHSFYIDRYPPGREATLNYPTLDVRWTNTTTSPILIRTSATSSSITVTLYGHNDGRWVEAISGPRTPVPNKDFRMRITRRIHLGSGRVLEDGFTTTYNKPPEEH